MQVKKFDMSKHLSKTNNLFSDLLQPKNYSRQVLHKLFSPDTSKAAFAFIFIACSGDTFSEICNCVPAFGGGTKVACCCHRHFGLINANSLKMRRHVPRATRCAIDRILASKLKCARKETSISSADHRAAQCENWLVHVHRAPVGKADWIE